ncbi:hypothetical protein V501_00479 [Pseudogymnoascus sp. VKM F-4519 (FW-2642)]|nr:hypothetical protein V501_00479 [Pseudogymnoascus sp. VKM F-4519 (FW-2642)]
MTPIFKSEPQPKLESEALINPRLRREPEFIHELESSRIRAQAPEPIIELFSSGLNSEPSSGPGSSASSA